LEVTGLRRTDDPYLQMSTSNNVLCNHSEHMEALVTDDLVTRLRDSSIYDSALLMREAAADRIEELEAALQKIAKHDMQSIALIALKKDSE